MKGWLWVGLALALGGCSTYTGDRVVDALAVSPNGDVVASVLSRRDGPSRRMLLIAPSGDWSDHALDPAILSFQDIAFFQGAWVGGINARSGAAVATSGDGREWTTEHDLPGYAGLMATDGQVLVVPHQGGVTTCAPGLDCSTLEFPTTSWPGAAWNGGFVMNLGGAFQYSSDGTTWQDPAPAPGVGSGSDLIYVFATAEGFASSTDSSGDTGRMDDGSNAIHSSDGITWHATPLGEPIGSIASYDGQTWSAPGRFGPCAVFRGSLSRELEAVTRPFAGRCYLKAGPDWLYAYGDSVARTKDGRTWERLVSPRDIRRMF